MFTNTITLTYGDAGENHKGMQKIGLKADKGFTHDDLLKMQKLFDDQKYETELVALHKNDLGLNLDEAYILIIRKGANLLLKDLNKTCDDLYAEQSNLKVDTKAFMYGRVVNKSARHNLCFADFNQVADYENKKGTVVDFKDVPLTQKIRTEIPKYLPITNLIAEGNYYYDLKKCGIGFHGDSERKNVIAVRLGASMPLEYHWFKNCKSIGTRIKFVLGHGDLYVMSEKASGFDWKKRSIYSLRHSAGAEKFLKIKE
jgi:hypothetical protein